uniref:Uncharacterized protein n=1 Tax=Ditylenchus dipsaci TaxID=166011 RepID=A0A915E2K3_9BILA
MSHSQKHGMEIMNDESIFNQATEFMEADDMYYDGHPSGWKMEKSDVLMDKLLDKDFYNDFGDLFDPDVA